jgi:membrane protein YqaA with SNARE-associated domain
MQVFHDPRAWLLVLVLGVLGLAVRLAAYKLGKEGIEAASDRFPQIEAEQWKRGHELLETRGAWVLVLAGVPGVGIVIVAAAGALEVRLPTFILWVSIGMLVRYWVLLLIAVGGYRLITG